MRHPVILASLCAGLLSGCYYEPDRAEILVDTYPPGAACVLNQAGAAIATVGPTPAIALVPVAASEIAVQCRRHGFAETVATLPPPGSGAIPGYVPNRGPGIDYDGHIEIALVPLPPGPEPR